MRHFPLLFTALCLCGCLSLSAAQSQTPSIAQVLALTDRACADEPGQVFALADLRTSLRTLPNAQALGFLHRCQEKKNRTLIPLVGELLASNETGVVIKALETLTLLGVSEREQADRVVALIADKQPMVCLAAMQAAASLGTEEAIAPMITVLAGNDSVMAATAHQSLLKISRQSFTAEANIWREWHETAMRSAAETLPRLEAQLRSPEVRTVLQAMYGLLALPLAKERVAAALLPLRQHRDQDVRRLAESGLTRLTSTDSGTAMTRLVVATDGASQRLPFPIALAKPTEEPAAVIIPAALDIRQPNFFDTWMGLVSVMGVTSGALALIILFLRTPAGQVVQQVSGRFARKAGLPKIVVMIEDGTRRLIRPMREATRRFAVKADRGLRKAEIATRRVARKAGSGPAASNTPGSAALERKTPAPKSTVGTTGG